MPLDIESYRLQFPVTRSAVYLDHAAVSPIPTVVRDAMVSQIEEVHHRGIEPIDQWLETIENVRTVAASLINAGPDEIAFVKNTSEGISLFATGLEWAEGDEVVSVEEEFPANYYPWKLLENRRVRLRLVGQPEGRIDLDRIARSLNPRTKVVTVSFVQFLSGYRLDLESLGRLCEDRGVLLFVDAIQGLGAFPLDVKKAKIAGLSADGHKWLLGPEGCGLFFVRRDVLDRLQPGAVGWANFKGWLSFTQGDPVWREGAGRFECGTLNTAGIYGLGAALNLISGIGVNAIADRILSLTKRLREGLQARGFRLYGPVEEQHCSGIVSFYPRGTLGMDAEAVAGSLRSQRIMVSARRNLVRISPHFYNTNDEIDQVLNLLR
ncbi:MAG: aminotransferase class V-fold PLP-dependent enzyme [Terriglobia bacterium]